MSRADCGRKIRKLFIVRIQYKALVLSREPVDCPLRIGNESLPQVKEFKYLGVLVMSGGTMEQEIGRRLGAAGAALHSL